jgi:hypothetical protein
MDRDKMSNLYREPFIDASYQVSVHLTKRFHRRRFFWKSNNQKQEMSVAAMFVNGSGRMSHRNRRLYIDASYQVSVHLANGFREESKKSA